MIQTTRTYFQTLQTLHSALLTGSSLFFGMAIFIVETGRMVPSQTDLNMPLYVASPALALAGILASRIMFAYRLKHVVTQPTLESKMSNYQTSLIVRYALVEGPTLFAIICFLLTGDYVFPVIALALIGYLFLIRPTKESALEHLQLSHEEFKRIQNPESEIYDDTSNRNAAE